MTHEAAAELRDLVERYARAVDQRDRAELLTTFTDDAQLTTPRGTLDGPDQIGSIPERLGRYLRTHHHVTDHQVTLNVPPDSDGDRATGITECTAEHVYHAEGSDRVYVMEIRYHDEYLRADGAWRIARRRLELLREDDRPFSAPD